VDESAWLEGFLDRLFHWIAALCSTLCHVVLD
jgi:hypothetical protein